MNKTGDYSKKYLKIAIKALFYLGLGNYWYVQKAVRYPRMYAGWSLLVNCFIVLGTLDKVLAYLRPDIVDEAKYEKLTHTACTEIPIVANLYIMASKRQQIRKFLKGLLEQRHDIATSPEVEARAVKKAKYISIVLCSGSHAYLAVTYGQMIVASYIEGTPLETNLTYFPTSAHVGLAYDLLRILVIGHFCVLVSIIISVQCLCIMSLIFIAAKFKQEQAHFVTMGENSRKKWDVEDFRTQAINGVKLHEHALWCARNVQKAFGHLFGIQISITIVLLVFGMINFLKSERTLVTVIVNILYSLSLNMLTACYMMISGDITHEAAGVACAVFHCGWERGRAPRGVRATIALALHRAQQPVQLTAFGYLVLSYENFINVLRSTYSFFAVVY